MSKPKLEMTFEQYQQQMIEAAKRIQGDRYPGDDFYNQECWRDYYEDNDTPEEAVREDMTYWD